jgi:hypothetical protein
LNGNGNNQYNGWQDLHGNNQNPIDETIRYPNLPNSNMNGNNTYGNYNNQGYNNNYNNGDYELKENVYVKPQVPPQPQPQQDQYVIKQEIII